MNKPSTNEWYAKVLAIKKFCEDREMGLTDSNYGHLATFFYDLFEQEITSNEKDL